LEAWVPGPLNDLENLHLKELSNILPSPKNEAPENHRIPWRAWRFHHGKFHHFRGRNPVSLREL